MTRAMDGLGAAIKEIEDTVVVLEIKLGVKNKGNLALGPAVRSDGAGKDL